MHSCRESADGTVFYREFRDLDEGEIVNSHPHNYPHDIFCVFGAIEVENTYPDDSVEIYVLKPGEHKQVKAIADHRVKSLMNGAGFDCIFPHRTKNGVLSDRCEGAREAYQ